MPRTKVRASVPSTKGHAVHIQALDRGLLLLERLAMTAQPVSLAELSRHLGVDRSTAHRLLGTLQQRGYVQQEAVSRHYRLGLKLVMLSRHVLDNLPWQAAAREGLRALMLATGESVNLVVSSSGQFTCVMQQPSDAALTVTSEVGAVYAPHATAAGKVLLAHLPAEQLAECLGPQPLLAYTPRTITDRTALGLHLNTVKRLAYAIDDEERYPAVRCVAAPILNHQAEVIAALSLSGPAVRLTYERLPELIQQLQVTAEQLSAALGYSPP
jgi:DNA-binding IclR family transcriptional regulator